MRRRHWLGLGCLLVLLVTGAYVSLAGQSSRGSAAFLDIEPADGTVPENETVAFTELSPAQQDLFERARNTTETVEIPPDVDDDAFADNRYVRYQNRTYETIVAVS
ncbi:hypothetical protein NDI56_06805 [Haloarcula sp. S1CR25-12]|uniref:DUF7979 domain-containing protein n=1 Tax=Haloarcula saliterrae TaxID=2950534 RepID=A0ABU2FA26_9EURY|nr:hypothetical protein [Haloarcula sp. S1CR25-12]MDS0259099.1 hypothetical protein [Haloarcula sp. S1CR25-12]